MNIGYCYVSTEDQNLDLPLAGRAAAQARGVRMGCKPVLSAPQVAHARTLRELWWTH
jgi:DNA invertase Pin-like site-specific DNA recombinase